MRMNLIDFLFCPPASVELKPIGLPVTRCMWVVGEDWMMTQRFMKGKREITITAFGRNWQEVKANFQYEIEQEKSYK